MSFGDEDDELNCTLWVGNLDAKITESALFEIFVQGGPIEKIHIPKGKDGGEHKGYCFITFQHNESVPYTMHVLDGTSLCGKVLKLQPRPGSKHKKLMDAAKENDHRQLIQPQLQQQIQMSVPATHQQGQPQWFLAPPHPQMAQFQNMLLYQNQMFQAYSPCLPNLNNGMAPTLVQLPSGMTTHLIPLPVQPQQVGGSPHQQPFPLEQQHHPHHHQYQRGPRPSTDYRNPRPTQGMANGYSMQRQPNGSSAHLPSQYSQSQVLNESHSQSLRFPQPNRGPRPRVQRPHFQNQQPASPRNSNNVNGNARPAFPQRSQAPVFQQASPPLVYTTPVYRHQSPPAVGGALQYQPQQSDRQFYQRPPFPTDVYTY